MIAEGRGFEDTVVFNCILLLSVVQIERLPILILVLQWFKHIYHIVFSVL